MVQQFTEAFVQALQMPDGPSSDSGLKMEVLKVREQQITECLSFHSSVYFLMESVLSSLLFSGSNGTREELPQTHGVFHAADPSNSLEHTD